MVLIVGSGTSKGASSSDTGSCLVSNAFAKKKQKTQTPPSNAKVDQIPKQILEEAQATTIFLDKIHASITLPKNSKIRPESIKLSAKDARSLARRLTRTLHHYKFLTSIPSPLPDAQKLKLREQLCALQTTFQTRGPVAFKTKEGEFYDLKLKDLFRHYLRPLFPDSARERIASFLDPSDIVGFLKVSRSPKFYEHIISLVNTHKMALADLDLSKEELLTAAPHLTFVDTRGLKSVDPAVLLNKCLSMRYLILDFKLKTLREGTTMVEQISRLLDQVKKTSPSLEYVNLTHFKLSSTTPDIQSFLRSWPSRNIPRLRLNCEHLDVKELIMVAPFLTNVTLMCSGSKDEEILGFLKQCKQLRFLCLHNPDFKSFEDSLVSRELLRLELYCGDNLESLPENLPIETIILAGCPKFKFFPATWPKLKSMTLESFYVPDAGIPLYPNLTYLKIKGCDLETLSDKLPVNTLDISGCRYLYELPPTLPKLKSLTLEYFRGRAIPNYPRLDHLQCSSCPNLTAILCQPKTKDIFNCPNLPPTAIPIKPKTGESKKRT